VGVLVWAVVVAAAIATARSRDARTTPYSAPDHRSRVHATALLACVGTLAVAFSILPHSIGWFGFVDGRLVPVVLLVGLMAVRRPALGSVLGPTFDRSAPLAAGAMVTIALVASQRFQGEAAGWKEVLGAVPANARLLNLPVDPNSEVFTAHPFVHYDKLVLADRPALVSDVWFHQGSGIYPTPDNPSLLLPGTYSESDLRFVDWPAYRLADWDYVLLRTRPSAPEPQVPPALTLTVHRGGWWLFRSTPP
jgi:hypothetical protein